MTDSGHPVVRSVRLAALFGDDVSAFELAGGAQDVALHPDEATIVSHAIPRRRREFAGGRLCARLALADRNVHGFALMSGPDRFPLWPADLIGSITHTEGYCGAVVAARSRYLGIGIDVEQSAGVDRSLWRHVCTQAELAWLERQNEPRRAELAALIFSAKEAFYKCQYCVTRRWLGFHDVVVEVDDDGFAMQIGGDLEERLAPAGSLRGRYWFDAGLVATGIGLVAADAAADADADRPARARGAPAAEVGAR